MSSLISLIKRDIKIFYRTKGNIMFASLSVMILLVLHFIIFRDMYTDSWVETVSQFPGFSIEREKLSWLVDNLMFSAILPIGAMTISLVALGLMVADREKNVLSDLLVSPIGRSSLLVSYLISSFLAGFVILIGFTVLFEVYFLLVYGIGFTLTQLGLILLTVAGSLIFANVFMLLLISFFKTQQSLGAVGTIIGTLMGFVCGAYIPVGMFGKIGSDVLSLFPFLQITVLSRRAFLYELESVTTLTRSMVSGELARNFGMELWVGDKLIPEWGAAAMAGGITLVLLIWLVVRFARMKKAD